MSETDRRIARTQAALWSALLALLREADWADIGVQTICTRANIGRSTFYAHFPTKQALLDWGFSRQAEVIAAEVMVQAATLPPDRLATVDWLVRHRSGAKGFVRRLAATPSGYAIQDRFRRALGAVLGAELAARGLEVPAHRLAFLTGGLFAAIEEGLARGDPPETLVAQLCAEVLRAA